MKRVRTDLHIHTVLSPCADLSMSPNNIIKQAKIKQLDMIGITDHNSTRHAALLQKIGEQNNIFVLMGVEVNTKEEVHCLAFFEHQSELEAFQTFLDRNIGDIPNNPQIMGDQVVVNETEEIVYEEKRWLGQALKVSIETVEQKVHALQGIFIPAHISRGANGILNQLGFIPEELPIDAVEVEKSERQNKIEANFKKKNIQILHGSDAHFIDQIGTHISVLEMEEINFKSFRKMLQNTQLE